MVRRQDGAGRMTRKLRQQVASTAAGPKELAVVYALLESDKAKADSLDEALKVNWKGAAVIKSLVEK